MMTDEEITTIQKELRAKGVKYCIGAYVDIHGVPKGKVVPIDHLHHMAHGSERYTGYALDGLGQAPNDDEITSKGKFWNQCVHFLNKIVPLSPCLK